MINYDIIMIISCVSAASFGSPGLQYTMPGIIIPFNHILQFIKPNNVVIFSRVKK